MGLSDADMAFAKELFADIPDLVTRKMFGGMALYSGPTIFALMMSDARLMLKAEKGPFVDHMAGLGAEQWTYTRKDGAQSSMPYWTLPDACLDSPEDACDLARAALDMLR
ncbi:MAG: TfoX/Sxy family protein [Sulfitobacter sp.]